MDLDLSLKRELKKSFSFIACKRILLTTRGESIWVPKSILFEFFSVAILQAGKTSQGLGREDLLSLTLRKQSFKGINWLKILLTWNSADTCSTIVLTAFTITITMTVFVTLAFCTSRILWITFANHSYSHVIQPDIFLLHITRGIGTQTRSW